jgi:CheY-like chemotaxis protein
MTEPKRSTAGPSLSGGAPPHILVVDNEPCLTEVIQALLQADGYRVSVANDVRTALRLAGKERPTMVLSDIVMPGLDGWGLLRELRRTPSIASVPVLFFSSYVDENRARELGAWGVLRKPASPDELLRKIFEVVAVGFMAGEQGDAATRVGAPGKGGTGPKSG